jgi:AcrR family transcriptional regulator
MGRKALEKNRKPLSRKAELWVRELFLKLQDKPLSTLTLDEIALLINKSKSTIYTYFTSKEEIYQIAVEMVLKDLEGTTSFDLQTYQNMELLYREIVLKINSGIKGISIQFLDEIKNHYPQIWERIQVFTKAVLDTLEAVYKMGMHTGEFHPFNLKLLRKLDDYFIFSIMTDTESFKNENLSLDDLVLQYLELRINALTAK